MSSNESQRPYRGRVDSERVHQRREVDYDRTSQRGEANTENMVQRERTRSSRERQRNGNNVVVHELEKKARNYKVITISLVVLYIVSFLIGLGFVEGSISEVVKYKEELESVKSDYEGKINGYESELADSRAYSSTLSDKLEEIGEIDVEGYESQISSLKKKNKKYEKKIKSYKEKINSYKSKIEEQQAVIDAIPTPTPEPEVPLEYEQALKQGQSYLSWTQMSKQGLYDQLLYEGYPADAAQYAVDTLFG